MVLSLSLVVGSLCLSIVLFHSTKYKERVDENEIPLSRRHQKSPRNYADCFLIVGWGLSGGHGPLTRKLKSPLSQKHNSPNTFQTNTDLAPINSLNSKS